MIAKKINKLIIREKKPTKTTREKDEKKEKKTNKMGLLTILFVHNKLQTFWIFYDY